MAKSIALFRGINVSGKNKINMRSLTQILAEFGLKNIHTYVQSGNVIFDQERKSDPELGEKIGSRINAQYGFQPKILLLSAKELDAAIKNNPFSEAENDPSSFHLGFLEKVPVSPKLEKLKTIKKDSEEFALIGKVFYLKAPEGIGRSKLAANSEKLLGEVMTDRNWRTVLKIREMVNIEDT